MLSLLFLLQAAAAPQAQPDIQLNIDASIRRVTIERRGEASLDMTASPDGGSAVHVEAPQGNGRRTMRNVNVRVRGEARIVDPAAAPSTTIEAEAETASPQ